LGGLRLVPLTQAQACDFVAAHHRHHAPRRDKYRIGVADCDGVLRGVVQVGRPSARALDDAHTLEVLRLCTDGTKNACSALYAAAARAAKNLGYSKIITYILDSETGVSLRAAGWAFECVTSGGSWDRPSRRRNQTAPLCKKQRWAKKLTEEKT